MADDTLIAGYRTVKDWQVLKKQLDEGGDPELWQKAFQDFFMERLKTRYFEPIEAIDQIRSHAGKGFAIMTIFCSLLEFLESTIQGRKYVRKRKEDCGKDEYSDSGEMFQDFLQHRPPFTTQFGQNPKLAEQFYKNVRCGLLHEARTKHEWKINVAQSSATSVIDEQQKIVYWDNFRKAVDIFLEEYRAELLQNGAWQEAFKVKFDGLCD